MPQLLATQEQLGLTPPLEDRFPGLRENIRTGRYLGFSDEDMLGAITHQTVNLKHQGFDDFQINEMQEGVRPFPPTLTADALRGGVHPSLTTRLGAAYAPARHSQTPAYDALSEFGQGLRRGATAGLAGPGPESAFDPGSLARTVGEIAGDVALFSLLFAVAPKSLFGAALLGTAVKGATAAGVMSLTKQLADKGEVDPTDLLVDMVLVGGLTGLGAVVAKKVRGARQAVAATPEAGPVTVPKPEGPRFEGAVKEIEKNLPAAQGTELAASVQISGERDALQKAILSQSPGIPTSTLARMTDIELKLLRNQDYAAEKILGKDSGMINRLTDRGFLLGQQGDRYLVVGPGGGVREFNGMLELDKFIESLPIKAQAPVDLVMDAVVAGKVTKKELDLVAQQQAAHTLREADGAPARIAQVDPSGMGIRANLSKNQLIGKYGTVDTLERAKALVRLVEQDGLKANILPTRSGEFAVVYARPGDNSAASAIRLLGQQLAAQPGLRRGKLNGLTPEEHGTVMRALGHSEEEVNRRLHPLMASVQTGVEGKTLGHFLDKEELDAYTKAVNAFRPTAPTEGLRNRDLVRFGMSTLQDIFDKRGFNPIAEARAIKETNNTMLEFALTEHLLQRLPEYLASTGIPRGPAQDRVLKPIVNRLTRVLSNPSVMKRGFSFQNTIESIDAKRAASGLQEHLLMQQAMRLRGETVGAAARVRLKGRPVPRPGETDLDAAATQFPELRALVDALGGL